MSLLILIVLGDWFEVLILPVLRKCFSKLDLFLEEMVSTNNNIFWSLDGMYMAYLVTDDTLVDKIKFSKYENRQYPEMVNFKKLFFVILNICKLALYFLLARTCFHGKTLLLYSGNHDSNTWYRRKRPSVIKSITMSWVVSYLQRFGPQASNSNN